MCSTFVCGFVSKYRKFTNLNHEVQIQKTLLSTKFTLKWRLRDMCCIDKLKDTLEW